MISLSITGYLVGNIWMPNAECFKDLNYNVTREQARTTGKMTLRDHVLRATADGDFRSCAIAQGELIVTKYLRRNDRTICETRAIPLSRFPSISDCLHDDPEWTPDYPEED